VNHSTKLAALALSLTLAACSSLKSDKVDYKGTTKKAPELAVPPDLTQLTRDSRYATPGATVTASGYQTAGQIAPTALVAAKSIGDVRVERAGTQRWLVVDRPADKLWDTIKDFWQENGLLLTVDQPSLGIMETDWAENRAKLPQDFVRGTIGKIFDSAYSTGELDKYRTRLERNTAGGTEIYISHRGMVEVYDDAQGGKSLGPAQDGGRTVWQARPVDPELEAEFLRRLMVKLGTSQEQAKSLEAAAQTKQTSRIASVDGRSVVVIDEGFDRAWRRVGLSLDRTGFTVEDRDRVQGTYFVRYVDPTIDKTEPGFFSKLFGATAKTAPPQKFRILVKGQGESTTVSVLNANGEPESSDNGQRILKVLVDDLK
jgi:outer membrane protein assembly factor BamC